MECIGRAPQPDLPANSIQFHPIFMYMLESGICMNWKELPDHPSNSIQFWPSFTYLLEFERCMNLIIQQIQPIFKHTRLWKEIFKKLHTLESILMHSKSGKGSSIFRPSSSLNTHSQHVPSSSLSS